MDYINVGSRLSKELFGIEWRKYFPIEIEGADADKRFTIRAASYEECLDFFTQHADLMRQNCNAHLLSEPFHAAKQQFYRHHIDHFAIDCDQQMVGYYSMNPSDWSTYYLRYNLILPAYRGAQVGIKLTQYLLSILQRHGVERAEVHIANNFGRQIQKFIQLGFMPTGHLLSERWGNHLVLTYFCNEQAQQILDQHFFLCRSRPVYPPTCLKEAS